MNHPNIVKLIEAVETEERLFLIMEHIEGLDMYDYLKYHGCMGEREAQGIFRQVVSAIEYCHQKGIAHRDLKPENILLDSAGHVKVIDFGLGTDIIGCQLHTFCGTVPYAAPELFLSQGYEGRKADVWSLGVVLYTMLTETLPFRGNSHAEIQEQILKGEFEVPSHLSVDCVTLLRKLLTVNPNNRGPLQDIMRDRWLNLGHQELSPYIEPPRNVMHPWVTQKMINWGFEKEHIENSVRKNSYNRLMGTYLMLRMKISEAPVRTIHVQAYVSADRSSPEPSPTHKLQPEGEVESEPAFFSLTSSVNLQQRNTAVQASLTLGNRTPPASPTPGIGTPPASLTLGAGTPAASLMPGTRTPPASPTPGMGTPPASPTPGAGTPPASPTQRTGPTQPSPKPVSRSPPPSLSLLCSLESQTSPPRLAPQSDPWGSHSTHSIKNSSSGSSGAPEGTNTGNSLPAAYPAAVTAASSSGRSQGCRRVARRFLTVMSHLFCWPCTKRPLKINQIKPL